MARIARLTLGLPRKRGQALLLVEAEFPFAVEHPQLRYGPVALGELVVTNISSSSSGVLTSSLAQDNLGRCQLPNGQEAPHA